MVTEILSHILSGAVTSFTVLLSLSRVVPQAFGAPELKGPLYMTAYLMFTWRPFSYQYFHASNFTSSSSMDSALITISSLNNSNYGQSVLNSVNRASYITIKSSGIRKKSWWTSTPKLLAATIIIVNNCPAFHVLDHAMHQLHQLLVELKACTLPTCCPLYANECDVEWLVRIHVQLL